MDLPSLGEKKVALFALIPDNDTSFNFLVSILYTQLFQQLFYLPTTSTAAALPVPVHFLMDEFSNVSLARRLFKNSGRDEIKTGIRFDYLAKFSALKGLI